MEYPIGTVAQYGPDDKTVTKVAAGIILYDGAEPIMKRWVATDITTNPKMKKELGDFFSRLNVPHTHHEHTIPGSRRTDTGRRRSE